MEPNDPNDSGTYVCTYVHAALKQQFIKTVADFLAEMFVSNYSL